MSIPQRLGHFELLEEIGHGGLSTVYRAMDTSLRREVAIKLLREDLTRNGQFVEDFLREARIAAAMSHPHIVHVYYVDEENGQQYIVMELLNGRTLRESIDKDGPLDEERALEIGIDVAEALRAAYRNQMIHGDIKPANVFVTEDAGAKVLDFGLAKLANVEVAATGEVWGSPHYVSPERAGRKAEDFRSDVYSLGATLFHALTGRPPFEADTPEELAMKRLQERPPLLRDLNPVVTQKTEQAINKMLNKSVLLRYLDYDAVLHDLRDARTEATARRLGMTVRALPEPTGPPKKLSLLLVVAGIAGMMLVAGAVTLAFIRGYTQKSYEAPALKPTEFHFSAPQAKGVFLSGEFNNWSATATPMKRRNGGDWFVKLPLGPGQHAYKFVVDGKWVPDPANPARVNDPYGGVNSIVTVGK